MKTLTTIIATILISSVVFSQGINFENGTFDEALAKAKAENKLVFMDCYTVWCGPCKWMDREIFPHKTVGEHFNAKFINVKMDMEKGEGIKLNKRYAVKAYPTLLFLDAEGKVLHTRVGGLDAETLIAEAKKAADPAQRVDAVAKKYESGERSPALVASYLELLQSQYEREKVKEVGTDYLEGISSEELLSVDNFRILSIAGTDYGSDKHLFVKENQEKLVALTDTQSVQQFLYVTHYWYIAGLTKNETTTFEELDREVKAFRKVYSDEQNVRVERIAYTEYFLARRQYDNYLDQCRHYIKEDLKKEASVASRTLISYSYKAGFEDDFNDVKGANKYVIKNAKKVISIDPESPSPYLLLANVYRRMGKEKQAVENADLYVGKMEAAGRKLRESELDLVNKIKGV